MRQSTAPDLVEHPLDVIAVGTYESGQDVEVIATPAPGVEAGRLQHSPHRPAWLG